jgi:tRNA(Ile)-lysidine synthase
VPADTLPRRVEEHLGATGLLGGTARLIAAVSGGADSTALACLLAPAARRGGWTLHVAHVRHLLRGASAERDADGSGRLAERLGLPFLDLTADVPSGRAKGESLEAAARRLRYAALLGAAAGLGGALVATGHTLDDQAETVLLNLARHAGRARGGIRERRPDGVVRPLLPFRREELRAFLRVQGMEWREDETNRDTRLLRNRIRLETLPGLERSSPGIGARLARAGAAWSGRLEALDARIDRELSRVLAPAGGPWPRSLFSSIGADAAARLLVRAAGAAGAVPGRVQLRRAIERILGGEPRFSEGLAGMRLQADERAVRMARPDKLPR